MGEVSDQVVAVVHEALSNAARHAGARHVSVGVAASGGEVVVVVVDDGRGIAPTARRSGLRNLEERAKELDGTLVVDEPGSSTGSAGPGTRLTWSVPLRAATAD